jgi:hypothetical protein
MLNNKYITESRWLDDVEERLQLGIKLYGTNSEFISDYSNVCIRMKKDDVEDLFKKYGLYTRLEKIKKIKTLIKF